ncbi:MAE_28990/MAE_18760 family HEPN-like nuclease [Pantoea ananatis]|uniref:MAE_28990/MAE_18760 family HEPN-like nuclease n=1 Tax=Pantoea ananas TaxID=553 RepID=UPI001B30E717|nr:MAE_28990/MAE_18760 family HEPN-like nuclease [Pantoea ananatis]
MMLEVIKDNTEKDIIVVLDVFNDIYSGLTKVSPNKVTKIRQYAYATAVTRLYAIFEHFIEKTLSSYLDYLSENKTYADLSPGLKKEYRIGFSHVLSRIDQPRFSALNHEDLIEKYHRAINERVSDYQFIAEALIRHDNNLRPNVIFELFNRLGLTDLERWLVKSATEYGLYDSEERVKEQFESELNNLIEVRNDSSHGVPEQIGSQSILQRHCELIFFLVSSITSFVEREIFILLQLAGKTFKIGNVTEVFKRAGASVAKVNKKSFISLGVNYVFEDSFDFYTQKFSAVKLNDSDVGLNFQHWTIMLK